MTNLCNFCFIVLIVLVIINSLQNGQVLDVESRMCIKVYIVEIYNILFLIYISSLFLGTSCW